MKYLLLIVSHFIFLFAGAQVQQSTKQKGDKIWLTSDDTTKVKVYKVGTLEVNCVGFEVIHKYDTIGPQLRLVSDTAHDHWNGVSAMWVYEVRVYNNKWIEKGTPPNKQGASTTMSLGEWIGGTPEHFIWLDSKKKPLILKVWNALIESPAHDSFNYSRGGGAGLSDLYNWGNSIQRKEINHDNPYWQ